MKEKLTLIGKSLLKSFVIALIIVVVVSAAGLTFAAVRGAEVTLSYATIPNYIIGIVVIFMGFGHMLPAAVSRNTMHNTANAGWRAENMRDSKGNFRSLLGYAGAWVIVIAGATDFVSRM